LNSRPHRYCPQIRAAVPVEIHIYQSGGHGFGIRPSAGPAAGWAELCVNWLRNLGFLKGDTQHPKTIWAKAIIIFNEDKKHPTYLLCLMHYFLCTFQNCLTQIKPCFTLLSSVAGRPAAKY
jgi:hypothetical protein